MTKDTNNDVHFNNDERPETFKETLKNMAESSSLHGITKIVTSRQILVKVLWSLLVLASFSVFTIQLYYLFRTYYSYPSQTSVSLDFSPIAFPAITLCNMNPVRKSELDTSNALQALLKSSSDRPLYKRRRRETAETEENMMSNKMSKELPIYNVGQSVPTFAKEGFDRRKQAGSKTEADTKNDFTAEGKRDRVFASNQERSNSDDQAPVHDYDQSNLYDRQSDVELANSLTEIKPTPTRKYSEIPISDRDRTGNEDAQVRINPVQLDSPPEFMNKIKSDALHIGRRKRAAGASSNQLDFQSSLYTVSDEMSNKEQSTQSVFDVSSSTIFLEPSTSYPNIFDSQQSMNNPHSSLEASSADLLSSTNSEYSDSYSDSYSDYYANSYSGSYSDYYSDSYSGSYSDYYSWSYSDYGGYSSYYNWGGDGYGYYFDQLSVAKDEWEKRVENFRQIIKNESLPSRRELGHQKEDMILSATFNGRVQNVSHFQEFMSVEYGNCYTIESPKYVAWRSGPSHAIKLTMNVEIDEYVDNLSTGYGIRIVFHEPGTYPLPSHEGITLSPGTETNIGLRMVQISRLEEPHGECIDGKEFARRYGKKYSIAACYEFCRILKAIQDCECIPAEAPDEIHLNSTALPVCNTEDDRVEKCLLQVDVQFDSGDYSCDCNGPCKETVYAKTMSSTYWPTDDYLEVLISERCEQENITSFWHEACSQLEYMRYYELDRYRYNFLRVLIYYEDLNYESITEEPMYESVRFLSDIGGAMGLFLGASVLSFVEFVQLILEIVLFIKHKMEGKNQVMELKRPISST